MPQSIHPIVYRQTEGRPLTIQEIDGNFKNLHTRIADLEDTPPQAEGIDCIEQDGDQIIVHSTKGRTFGPFSIPKIFWNPTGPWQQARAYKSYDIVSYNKKLFMCTAPHVSSQEFKEALCHWREIFSWEECLTPAPKVEKKDQTITLPLYTRSTLPDYSKAQLGQLIFIIDEGVAYWNGYNWAVLTTQN